MKNKLSALAVIVSGLLLSQSTLADEAVDKKFVDESSYTVGTLMGKKIVQLVEAHKELISYDQDRILQGVQDTLKKTGKLTDEELQKQFQALNSYLAKQEQKITEAKNKEAIATGDKFRSSYEKKSGVKKAASGLLYKIEKAGEGDSPKPEDTVKVHYKGTLPNGKVFDNSYERGEPLEFQLNKLIPAWIEAIPMLKKGGKMEIVVPPELGYGNRPAGTIPAYSTLKFEIELLDFTAKDKK